MIKMSSIAQDASDSLNDYYNELMHKRISLLLELDKLTREMDRVQLAMAKIDESDEQPEGTPCTP